MPPRQGAFTANSGGISIEHKRYDFHEAANIFPLMEGTEFDELVQDIRDNGLRTPVELYEDKIIDGRNRYRACLEAGVEPLYVNVSPSDPVAYVLSKNLYRRRLTASQRAMSAARAVRLYEQEAKERQRTRKGEQPGQLWKNYHSWKVAGLARKPQSL